MKRRAFLKSAGCVFTGLIWVPPTYSQLNISRPAFAAVATKPAAGGGGCTDTEQFAQGSDFDGHNFFNVYTWLATSFVASSSFTCCKSQADLLGFGTVAAGNIQAKIYTNNAGSPGTLVGSGSSTIDRTAIPSSYSYRDFASMNASISNGTTYWYILQASSADTDASNGVYWKQDSTGQSGATKASTDGSSWDDTGGSMTFNFKLFN